MYVFLNFALNRFGLKHLIGVFISSEVSLCSEGGNSKVYFLRP